MSRNTCFVGPAVVVAGNVVGIEIAVCGAVLDKINGIPNDTLRVVGHIGTGFKHGAGTIDHVKFVTHLISVDGTIDVKQILGSSGGRVIREGKMKFLLEVVAERQHLLHNLPL